jgi:hypothetical protein
MIVSDNNVASSDTQAAPSPSLSASLPSHNDTINDNTTHQPQHLLSHNFKTSPSGSNLHLHGHNNDDTLAIGIKKPKHHHNGGDDNSNIAGEAKTN